MARRQTAGVSVVCGCERRSGKHTSARAGASLVWRPVAILRRRRCLADEHVQVVTTEEHDGHAVQRGEMRREICDAEQPASLSRGRYDLPCDEPSVSEVDQVDSSACRSRIDVLAVETCGLDVSTPSVIASAQARSRRRRPASSSASTARSAARKTASRALAFGCRTSPTPGRVTSSGQEMTGAAAGDHDPRSHAAGPDGADTFEKPPDLSCIAGPRSLDDDPAPERRVRARHLVVTLVAGDSPTRSRKRAW